MSRAKLLALLSGISFCLLLSSCAHLTHLDAAQDSFNEGATLDNEMRFSTSTSPTISPAFHYNRAYVSVNKALKGGGDKKLEKDQLLGHAFSVKALCEWKLGQYDLAVQSCNQAKGQFLTLSKKGIKMPRDLILMKALPSIIAIDTIAQSYFAFRNSWEATHFDKCLAFYQSHIFAQEGQPALLQHALDQLEELKKEATNNAELYAYLVMVQLSGLKTWNGCLSLIFEKGISKLSISEQIRIKEETLNEKQAFFNTRRQELLEELENTLAGEGELKDKLIDYWKGIM
jgi:hypothetical protein